MKRLTDDHLHVLRVVEKHGSICIGLPVSAEWELIADMLRWLARARYLIEDGDGDDGPVYRLSQAGRSAL